MKPLVSVVIPAKNEEKFLPKLLGTLMNQTYDNLEIIVVDDGSTDRTPEIAIEFKKKSRFPIKLVKHEKTKGLTVTRNDGVRNSKGEVIVMFDADNEVNPEYVSKALGTFTENTIGVIPVYKNTKDTFVERCIVSILNKKPLEMPLFWNRKELDKLGYWDESLGFGGDRDMYWRLNEYRKKTGKDILVSNGSILYVHHPHTLKELFRQQQYYGRGLYIFMKKNPNTDNFKTLFRIGFPLFYIGPAAALLGVKFGWLLLLLSLPYILIELKRTINGLRNKEVYALLMFLIDTVKWLGLVVGISDFILKGKKYRE